MPTVKQDVENVSAFVSDQIGELEEPSVMAFTGKQLMEAARGNLCHRMNHEVLTWLQSRRPALAEACRTVYAIEVVPVSRRLFDKLRGKSIVPADEVFDETFMRSCLAKSNAKSWGVVCIPASVQNHPAVLAYDKQMMRRANGFVAAASNRIKSQQDAGLLTNDAVATEQKTIPYLSEPRLLSVD